MIIIHYNTLQVLWHVLSFLVNYFQLLVQLDLYQHKSHCRKSYGHTIVRKLVVSSE